MKRKFLICILCACFLFDACSRHSYLEVSQDLAVSSPDASASNIPNESESMAPTPVPTILIHVSGAVACPGVYELPLGSRVFEAIEAAGGVTSDADSSILNLASPISDGMKITVPREGEYTTDTSNIVIGSSSIPGSTSPIVNINTADASTLTTIPGIGPSKASAIVKYREENGPFRSISDLANVSGIGEATIKKIQDIVVL